MMTFLSSSGFIFGTTTPFVYTPSVVINEFIMPQL